MQRPTYIIRHKHVSHVVVAQVDSSTPAQTPTTGSQQSAAEQFTGALGDLLAGRTDIIGNMFFQRDYGSRRLRFTAAIFVDRLCIVMRAAELQPPARLFVNVFAPPVWWALAVSVASAAAAYVPVHSCVRRPTAASGRHRSRYERCAHAVAASLRLVGVALSRQERGFGRTAAERWLLLVCLWHSVVMVGLFQGQLYDVYTHPRTAANVNTIDELAAAGDVRLAIRFRGIAADVLGGVAEQPTPTQQRLRAKVVEVAANSSVYETVLGRRGAVRMADIDRLMNYQLVAPQYRRKADGRSRVHVLPEYPK